MSGIQPGKTEGPITGTFTPGGLSTALRVTTMNVTDVATALPAVPLASRVAIKVTNLHATEVLYIGDATVTADRVIGITAGDEVGPGESFNVDITDSVILYGRAEAGETILVKIMEIS